jgi:CHAT domain
MPPDMPLTTAAIAREGPAGVDPTTDATKGPEPPPPPIVDGAISPGEPEPLRAVPANLAAAPPAIAWLHVEDRGSDRYVLSGACGSHKLAPTEFVTRDERLLQRKLTGAKIAEVMTLYARKHPLRKWLKDLRREVGDGLVLVIHDCSSTGIPWEMFELANVGYDYLGAAINTVRWVYAEDDRDEEVSLCTDDDVCQGKLLAHLDPQERGRADIVAEVAALEGLGPERIDDILALRDRMNQADAGVGLVYLFCHGFVGDSSFQLGGKGREAKRLSFAHLVKQPLALLRKSRSVVFVNACNSGIVLQDTTLLSNGTQQGFAELFLGKGARGVLGTLADVEVRRAADIARRVLERVTAQTGASVARVLRELRAEVASAMPPAPTPDDYERLYTTFLYVYYGNPRTLLRVERGAHG